MLRRQRGASILGNEAVMPRERDSRLSALLARIANRIKPAACVKCHSREIRRSRRRGVIEFALKRLFRIVPWRCECCQRRFYGF